MILCPRCKVEKDEQVFKSIRGKTTRYCAQCREYSRTYMRKKCTHGRRYDKCRDCGTGLCVHGRQSSQCRDCGTGLCMHGRQSSRCRDCGRGVCLHGRRFDKCRDCGTGLCVHNRNSSLCRDCGVGYCLHGRQSSLCRKCSDPIKGIISSMIRSSKQSDQKKNRYDANNFIDKCFIQSLIEESTLCHYCKVQMQFIDYNDTLITIERIQNDIGHIKSNCVLACRKCNYSRVGQRNKE